MARIQVGQDLADPEVAAVAAFFRSLTGEIPAGVTARLERLGLQ